MGGTRCHVELAECARARVTMQALGFWTNNMLSTADRDVPLQKKLLKFLLGPGRDRMPVHGIPRDHAYGKCP